MSHFTPFLSFALACLTLTSCVRTKATQPRIFRCGDAATPDEARASKWGFNAEDATEALQAALDSNVKRLVIDKMPSPWITAKPLAVRSNMEIIFEEGVELQAKRGEFKGRHDSLLMLTAVQNVTLKGLGNGATLRMHKKDYLSNDYEKAEWRHCIQIYAGKNITIENLTLRESGGDGIYLGVGSNKECSRNVTIRNVICDANNRQGLSVIGAADCLVENCQFINTWGTPPAAGVDFEPNQPGEQLNNIVLRNCITKNNQGCGYLFYLVKSNEESGTLNITLDNCSSSNEQQGALSFISRNGEGYERPGHILIRNCTFQNNKSPITFSGTSANGFTTTFENVTLKNIADGYDGAPIIFGYASYSTGLAGNFHLNNVNVFDSKDRAPFNFINGGLAGGLENVSGTITSYLNGKKNRVMVLSDEWAKNTYPKRDIKVLPALDITSMDFEPVTPGASAPDIPFSPIKIRGKGVWNILANTGDSLKLTAAFDQLVAYQGDFAPVTLTTPSGKNISLGNIPFKQARDFEIGALPESGLYTLSVNAGNNLARIAKCNLPVVMRGFPEPLTLCTGHGNLFFYVPEGTKDFAVQFIGMGDEGLKGTVFAPDGTQLWQMDDIARLEQFECSGDVAQKGGIFKITIEKPSHLPVLEDHLLSLTGVPSIFGLAPQLLIKQKK